MDPRRLVPRTDAVLADPRLAAAAGRLGPAIVRSAVAAARQRARDGEIPPGDVPDTAVAALPERACGLHPVVNATGVLLHTNLGRAPLSAAARDAVAAAAGCVDVEYDLATGRRGPRGRGALDALRAACPAAGAAQVVNNNAAALALAATALAAGREIVIGRGELVEIGDGFRLPDLLASTGARLREVGTTNRTTAADYAGAVGAETGFIMKVHPSNFRIEGFTAAADVADLVPLGVPVVVDIGSGLLAPDPALPDEPDAASVLAAGAALVTASGDKLLGGPQAGLLLGEPGIVERLRRHPLYRALRVDKMTLAALEATLRGPRPPVTRMLHADVAGLRERAEALAGEFRAHGVDARAADSTAAVGGGGAPGVGLPSAAVSLPSSCEPALRARGVIGRVEDGRLLLDLRSAGPAADGALREAVLGAAAPAAREGN
ncbi:L-seryl-tRNA(Sec) selenium transferase [Actinomadura vinacea]|uniref:L-seryl-tRNA(Sec) selenium transferase n=1 Tax=Actinomadura vinacea TaxID=115336 RepID=UPI0031DBF0FE